MDIDDNQRIGELLRSELDCDSVKWVKQVTGGLVNKADVYKTSQGQVFVKHACRDTTYDLFSSESESLHLVDKTGIIKVPKPIKVFKDPKGGAVFAMEMLDLKPLETKWEELGEKIARLHKFNSDLLTSASDSSVHKAEASIKPVDKFGFHMKTFYGSDFFTPADVWCDTWPEYFSRHLLAPQFAQLEVKYGDRELSELWSKLQLHLHKPFEMIDIKPAILHGDLCTINVGEVGDEPVMFDLGVSYGHKEFEFGQHYVGLDKFSETFWQAYHKLHSEVIYDPTCSYGHGEFDFTIPTMEENFMPGYYTSYRGVLPEENGFQTRISLYHVFAFTLITNSVEEMNLTSQVKDEMRNLVHKFEQSCKS